MAQNDFHPKDGLDGSDGTTFHGHKRSSDTHESTLDDS
jgi:hypothetical protein